MSDCCRDWRRWPGAGAGCCGQGHGQSPVSRRGLRRFLSPPASPGASRWPAPQVAVTGATAASGRASVVAPRLCSIVRRVCCVLRVFFHTSKGRFSVNCYRLVQESAIHTYDEARDESTATFFFRLPARALLPFEIFVSCAVCALALNTTSLSRRLCQRHEATLPVLLARPLARAGLWPRAPGSSPPSTWWRAVHFCPRPGRLSDLPREAALLMPKRALRMHLKQRFLSQAGNLQMAPLLTLNVPRGTLLAFSENALIASDCTGHKTFIFLLVY